MKTCLLLMAALAMPGLAIHAPTIAFEVALHGEAINDVASFRLTMPPPDAPSTSLSAKRAWAACSFSCMACACFIRDSRSFTGV